MSLLLRKEIRLLLPTWLVAVLLAAASPWLILPPENVGGVAWLSAIGGVILAVTAFGREFALGTSTLFLVQPIPRGRIMLVKSAVLLVALAVVVVALWLSYVLRVEDVIRNVTHNASWYYYRPNVSPADQQAALRHSCGWVLGNAAIGAAAIFAGGLWTTLMFRQMVASFWITVLVPTLLVGLTSWLGAQLQINEVGLLCRAVLLAYSILACVWAWRLFQRTEDTTSAWGGKRLPSVGALLGANQIPRKSRPGRSVSAIIRQEIALHQTSLTGAVVLLILNVAAIGVCASGVLSRDSDLRETLEMMGVFWLLLPLMLGASAIAEERRLGTLQARLCLPVSRRKQFILKFAVATVLGLVLGAGALLLTDTLGRQVGVLGPLGAKGIVWEDILWLPVACVGLTFIGFYASSLARSALQAVGTAVVLAIIATITIKFATTGDFRSLLPTAWIPGVYWATLSLVMLVLSYGNFGELHYGLRRVMRNATVILLTLIVVTAGSVGIYQRAWEFVIPLEPKHGPARITGPGPLKIAGAWSCREMLILLPNGRLWASGDCTRYLVPTPGNFLATSNWTDVAACNFQAIALRSDGTLWSLYRSELHDERWTLVEDSPRQMGNETNWVSIAAGRGHLLALKGDGTLWGWGGNKDSQVTEGPEEITNGPVRIGKDSDWIAVFAYNDSSVGVKRDGTAWQWGQVYKPRENLPGVTETTQTQPVRWNVDLRQVKKLVGFWSFDLLLHKDGSLWAEGQLYTGFLGTPIRPHYATTPVRVGGSRLWADVALTWSDVGGVSMEGQLFKSRWSDRKPRLVRVSRYSDWLAVENVFGYRCVAVAADGTVCCWDVADRGGALIPTRRPLVSLNLFEGAK